MVICLERGADLHIAQLMPLIGFTFLVPAHLGSPGKRAVKQVYDNNNNNDRLTAFDPGQPG